MIDIFKIYKYKNNEYYIKLFGTFNDLSLQIKKQGKLLKKYKIINDIKYYYKIQKTQILSNNIFQLFCEINDKETTQISDIFIKKLLETL